MRISPTTQRPHTMSRTCCAIYQVMCASFKWESAGIVSRRIYTHRDNGDAQYTKTYGMNTCMDSEGSFIQRHSPHILIDSRRRPKPRIT
jgi:hypothetical protein